MNTRQDLDKSQIRTHVDYAKVTGEVKKDQLPDGVGTVYRASGNLLIIRQSVKTTPKQFIGSVRSGITGFSTGASTRMRRYLRECLAEYGTMVTLTYPFSYPSNGKDVKQHLKRFLQEVRREYVRSGGDERMHSSFWFLEFQKRGAPHFHIFTTWAPDKSWVARRWYEIVNSEDIRHLHAGTRTEYLVQGRRGTISYAAKYAAKQEQKQTPENYENVGRFWGVFGRRHMMSAATFVKDSEAGKPDQKLALKKLYDVLNKHILSGVCEVVVRDAGVCVLNVLTKEAQREIRFRVAWLGVQVNREESIFNDAELDGLEGMKRGYVA